MKIRNIAHIALAACLWNNSALANNTEIESLRSEFNNIKDLYEQRISDLESRLGKDEQLLSSSATRNIYNNKFNPSIGVILNGQYSNFSNSTSEFNGFGVGEEGERGQEGFSLGESELNFASNIDDKFFGSVTAAIVNEDGSDLIELEEAFIRTTPGFGLPTGFEVKAGRSFWNLGYLNSHHAHTDDFSDRPLPYRVFMNNSFNDDGAQLSYVLPTDIYAEIGVGAFRGDDFPFGGGDGTGSYSFYSRVGGDIGANQSWIFGLSVLDGEAKTGRVSNEDTVTFIGDSDLYIADFRYVVAPTGNSKQKELILQGEYFYRSEDGTYEDSSAATGAVDFDDDASGWYMQAIYKFKPEWRIGARYSELLSSDVPTGLANSALDSSGHDPKSYTAMIDWSNSEFSRVRFQYSREELSVGEYDNQTILQYVVSFGAHTAHAY